MAPLVDVFLGEKRVRVGVSELTLKESLAHPGRKPLQRLQVLGAQVLSVVLRVDLERRILVWAADRIARVWVALLDKHPVRPVRFRRRVAVVVSAQLERASRCSVHLLLGKLRQASQCRVD